MTALEAQLAALGAERVLCVLSSTSCFAPRAPDKLVPIARLCMASGVPHVVNNAYGVQSRTLMKLIEAAGQNGRVDAVVQSTDKNLCVPVGGAIVASFGKGQGAAHSKALLASVGATYAGRASVSPIADAFCTLLYLGADGYAKLVDEREANMAALAEAVGRVAERHGERLIASPANPISIAVTLGGCLAPRAGGGAPRGADGEGGSKEAPAGSAAAADPGGGGGASGSAATAEEGCAAGEAAPRKLPPKEYTAFGARLFQRLCSGARVVVPTERKVVDGVELNGFGAHVANFPTVYFTVAAALGQTRAEIELFAKRLDAVFCEFERIHAQQGAEAAGHAQAEPDGRALAVTESE